jgi:prepilin-type N-terminal cleavage/methylation domain-containing protein
MKKMNRGFTLVELLVVLVILAALTSVALTSVDVYEGQARYEATQRTLQNIEDAVIGPANQRDADGSLLITGFVADMGRLPRAYDLGAVYPDLAGKQYPWELWENPRDGGGAEILLPFQLRSPADDAEVRVMCGWRGPYVRLGVGQTVLNDGWGNPFDLLAKNRSPIALGGEVAMFRSCGADFPLLNAAPSKDYNEELYSRFVSDGIAAYPTVSAMDSVYASLVTPMTVNVTFPGNSASLSVIVRSYGPDGNNGGLKTFATAAQPLNDAGPLTFILNDPTLTIGPRVIRAYTVDAGGVLDNVAKSQIQRVTLRAGGNSLPDLVLK